jgi:ribulose-5-phosphate 4-epimerase/fuculose-1-phosphate aldolase
MQQEGVIKFELVFQQRDLEPRRFGNLASQLISWRHVMSMTQLIGQNPELYEGAGYGNVSARVGPPNAALGRRAFLITGSQKSGKPAITLEDFSVVERYDIRLNRVDSYGPVPPSSESMTHGAIYDLGPHLRCVLHAHSPVLWQQARALRIPTTDPNVTYGTPEMAREVQRLFRETAVVERQILAMGGHEDGIVAFGRSPEEAGQILITELAKAFEARYSSDSSSSRASRSTQRVK